ncbi:hypothetical protein K438DRAFT_63729 [Mycena galopus ATCC 62051]|nr:hypothetical protein K438DRAFT_63729 [Mycena galopus ATCC 62051]
MHPAISSYLCGPIFLLLISLLFQHVFLPPITRHNMLFFFAIANICFPPAHSLRNGKKYAEFQLGDAIIVPHFRLCDMITHHTSAATEDDDDKDSPAATKDDCNEELDDNNTEPSAAITHLLPPRMMTTKTHLLPPRTTAMKNLTTIIPNPVPPPATIRLIGNRLLSLLLVNTGSTVQSHRLLLLWSPHPR